MMSTATTTGCTTTGETVVDRDVRGHIDIIKSTNVMDKVSCKNQIKKYFLGRRRFAGVLITRSRRLLPANAQIARTV